jgi:hypothetical protein
MRTETCPCRCKFGLRGDSAEVSSRDIGDRGAEHNAIESVEKLPRMLSDGFSLRLIRRISPNDSLWEFGAQLGVGAGGGPELIARRNGKRDCMRTQQDAKEYDTGSAQ